MQEDVINKPDHYHKGGFDVYDIMQAKFSPEKEKGFCIGNVLKYVIRYEMKGGTQSLEKALFNLKKLIELEEGKKVTTQEKIAKFVESLEPGELEILAKLAIESNEVAAQWRENTAGKSGA